MILSFIWYESFFNEILWKSFYNLWSWMNLWNWKKNRITIIFIKIWIKIWINFNLQIIKMYLNLDIFKNKLVFKFYATFLLQELSLVYKKWKIYLLKNLLICLILRQLFWRKVKFSEANDGSINQWIIKLCV